MGIGGLGDWFKKRISDAGNGAAAAYHGLNVFDKGQGFTTAPVQNAYTRSQAAVQQRLNSGGPLQGVLADPNQRQSFFNDNNQAPHFNPITSLPGAFMHGGVQVAKSIPATFGVNSAIDAARYGQAYLTGNRGAQDAAVSRLATNVPQILPIAGAEAIKPFAQDVASAALTPWANHQADLQEAYAKRVLGNAYAPYQGGQNFAEIEAAQAGSGIRTDPLNRAGINVNDSLGKTSRKVGGAAAQTAANIAMFSQLPGVTGSLATTMPTFGGLMAVNALGQTAQQEDPTLYDYASHGLQAGIQGAVLPLAFKGGSMLLDKGVQVADRAGVTIRNGNAPAPAANDPIAQLQSQLPKGFKVDKTGSVFDAKGNELTTGQIQNLTQPAYLSEFEMATQKGDHATMQRIAAEHPEDGRVHIGATAAKPGAPLEQTAAIEGSLTGKPGQPTILVQDKATGPQAGSKGVTVKTPAGVQVESPSGGQLRNRGFIDTIFNDPSTSPKVKQALMEMDTAYNVRNTADLQTKAANFVNQNRTLAEGIAKNVTDDKSLAIASELWGKRQNEALALQKSGNHIEADAIFGDVIDQANAAAAALTKAGQFTQAASVYGKIAPEGVIRFAQREITKYNEATGKNVKLTTEAAAKLVKMAEDIKQMPDGPAKIDAIGLLVKEVQHQMPATLAEKLGTLQTMAQLLNPKTNIRNIGGNTMFAGLENVSQVVGTGVDKLMSLIRGSDRTTGLPSLKTQAKGGIEGLKAGIHDAKLGIDTGPNTQFDLNSVPTFRGKILGNLEKLMNGTLRGADRAAYTAAFDDTIRSLMKINKTDKVTPAMIEQAHQTGLYRTFQDGNAVSGFFVGMKKSLNKLGIGIEGKRFGLGDIVLKYPKTPGNLLARGIDYSPAGFIKSIFEASKPLFGKEFNQKAFVDSFSRAVVGSSSAFGVGFALSKNGIITAAPETNKDLRNVQKTAGQGGYQINVSALKRWVASGFNEDAAKLRDGDQLVSYDWAQPIAIPISAGAALGAEKPVAAGKEAANTGLNSINTLVEQPLLQGVQRLFGGYGGVTDAAVNTATSAPASFVPTMLSQINQLFDNKTRNTTDANPVKEAANLVKAKIPGAAQTLPGQVDVLGNDKERYQNGGNNAFNVLFNPTFMSNYKPNSTANEVLGLYNRTGETKQTPNTVPNNVVINDKKVTLTGQQQADYQRFTGERTNKAINMLVNDPSYTSLPDSEKVKFLSNMQTDINNAAKVQVFGDNPKDLSQGAASVLAGNIGGGNGAALTGAANDVQVKVAVEKFKTSGEKTMLIGDQYYFKKKDGTVSSMPKIEYDYNQADSVLSLGMDRAQASDDLGTWMKMAEQKYNALESKKSLYDPGTEADKIDSITLAQENLMQKVQQYQEYGGFKKGKAGKGLPSVNVGISSDLMAPVVSNAAYQAPKFTLKNKGSASVRVRRPKVKISAPKKLA